MQRFRIRCPRVFNDLVINVAMGEVFGGFCIVGPSVALTRVNQVFQGLLLAFPALARAYKRNPENYNPPIYLVTPDGPDEGKRLIHLLKINDEIELIPTPWRNLSDDVRREVGWANACCATREPAEPLSVATRT